MSSEDLDYLNDIWIKFLNTKNTDEGESWLDSFLARYLTLFCYNDIPPDHDFSFQYKCSANVLVHQMLTDVYQICEDVSINSSPVTENEVSAKYFQKYLLEGRGWKILWSLDKIGFQHLFHLKELVILLISQMPVVLSLPNQPSVVPDCLERKPKHLNLDSCFYTSGHQQNRLRNVDLRKPEMFLPLKRIFKGKKRVRRKQKIITNSSSSSEEGDVIFESCLIPASQLKSLMKVKQATNNSENASDSSESVHEYIGSDTSVISNVQDFKSYSISVVDYIGFILNLFQESLILDAKHRDIKDCTCPSVLEFSLHLLKEIHTNTYNFHEWSEDAVEDLKNRLLDLLFLSSTTARVSFNYNEAPNPNEIICTLFLISEEIINSTSGSVVPSKNIAFISHILKGSLMLVRNVIETCSQDYAKVICIIRTFTESGGNLCCSIFSLLDRQLTNECENELKIIILLIKEIITCLKILRTSATYNPDDMCEIKDYIHHHNDIFGPPVSHSIINKDPMCCIAAMSCLLFRLFGVSVYSKTSIEVLKNLKMSGICCCVNPSFIIKILFDGYASRDLETQKLILFLLGKHLFPQMGLTSLCQRRCCCCSKYLIYTEFSSIDITSDCSILENLTQILRLEGENSDSYLLIFNIYHDLLNLTDAGVLEIVTKHIIDLCSICVNELKIQLFVWVILPQFLSLKDISSNSYSPSQSIKMKCFLSILPSILSDVSLYSVFIKYNGIPIIMPFLLNSDLRDLALTVIKVLIYCENETLSIQNASSSCMPASRTFCTFLVDRCEVLFQKLNSVLKLTSVHSELLTVEDEIISSDFNFPLIKELSDDISFVCDIWICFKELVLNAKVDSLNYLNDGVLTSGYNLLILLLKNLSVILKLNVIIKDNKVEVILQLIQTLILILVNMKKEVQHKQSLLEIVKNNLKVQVLKCLKYQKLLFSLILKCCFWSIPTSVPIGRLHKHVFLEMEVMDSISSSDKNETQESADDNSYAGDTEGSNGSITSETVKRIMFCENFIEHGEFIKMLCELIVIMQIQKYSEWISTALHLVQTLMRVCQDCGLNKSVLCSHEIPPLLLDIFSNSLTNNQENLKEFQLATMDLFVELTESSMRVSYIKKIVDFFKSPHAPVDILLKSIINMIDHTVHNATWYITFPCIQKSNTSYLKVRKRLKATFRIYQQYTSLRDIPSAWTSAALFFPLTEDTKWNSLNKGFSFTLWIKFNNSSHICKSVTHSKESMSRNESTTAKESIYCNNLLHILSIGSDNFLIEFWCRKYSSDFVIRISTYINGVVTCLSEGTCNLLCQPNIWHHVAVIYSEVMEKSLFISKFQVIVDGVKEKICNLKHRRTGIKSLNRFHLLLGNSVPVLKKTASSPSYSIANFCLFRDDVLTKDVLYYLSSLGPDAMGITNCAIEKNTIYRPRTDIFNKFISTSNLNIFLGNKIPSLDSLQNSLICSFAAEFPNIYLVYPSAPRGFFPLRFTIGGRLSNFEDWPYQKLPLEYSSLSLAVIHPQEYHGFEYAIQCSGGIRIFLFLFAYVLEFSASEEILSAALNIILKLLNKSTTFVEDFIRIKGYELLTQMISNAKCCVSNDFFQVLIQNCMTYTYPEKEIFPTDNLPEVGNVAIITNPSNFNLMLKSLVFSRHVPDAIITGLFSLLDLLLNHKHSNLNINIEQLSTMHTLNVLMWLMKRNFILFDDNYFPPVVSKMIPIIIEKLLTYKFDINVIQSITRLLLLLHNASATYVCHSPSSFYFLTPYDKTDSSKEAKTSENDLLTNEVDAFSTLTQSPKLQRSSSLPGIHAPTEEGSVSKSKSIEFFPLTLSPAKMHMHWEIIDVFNIPKADVLSKGKMKDVADSSFVASKERSFKSVELFNGLLNLIYNFITNNTSEVQSMISVIKPEIFIVLAYTENPESCASVIKVIDAYLKATSEEKRHEFLSMKGFHLLANQLYQSPYNLEVIDACFSIIFNCPLADVNLPELNQNKISSFQIMSWIPVLALLPNTYVKEALCAKIIMLLTKFLTLGTVIIIELLENGLCVSLINLIIKLSQFVQLEPDEELSHKCICIAKIYTLLKYVAENLCRSKGSKGFESFSDALQLFSVWERKCQANYGSESVIISCLRNCQCIMYETIVKFSEVYKCVPEEREYNSFNDETSLWELVVELQGTFGTFSSISVPQSEHLHHTEIQSAVEAEELDKLEPESSKYVLEVPMNDVIDRLLVLIESAADFFIFKDHKVKITQIEKEFFKNFIQFIIEGLKITMDKKLVKSRNSSILYSLKNTFKKQISRLLVSSFAPPQDEYIKKCFTEILLRPGTHKVLRLMIFSVVKIENFLIFLYDLQSGPHSELQEMYFHLFTITKKLLENRSYLNVLCNEEIMEKQKEVWLKLWKEDRSKWIKKSEKTNAKMFEKMQFLAQDVSRMALYVTQQVFDIQNSERKILIEELKTKYYEEAIERMKWLELSEQMTHERAVWYLKDYYPLFWEVDPTEGPSRVRRRLQRCHIHMHPRFFKSDSAEALMSLKKGTPFIGLLANQKELPDSAVVLHRLFSNEQIKFTCPCKIVTAFEEVEVEILIGAYCIHIIGEAISLNAKKPITESWEFESIREIVPRRHELLNNSFEIFLLNGITYMIAFNSEKEFDIIWKQLEDLGLPLETNKDPLDLTQLWRDGTITNFEYLTHLNKLAGRTFNDLMQYPVFPYVLADYVSYFLNLENPASFRNLAKPIAVQLEMKEKIYKDHYESLSVQAEFDSSLPYVGPYHYGSHYSNSGTVLHFLIRLLPFTYSFISYQDRNFDCADRTFHNVATSWELVTDKSTSDVKEIIPEFYFLPEFLCNKNGFDFGVTQSGIRVNNVILPPWSKQNARLFILIHRQAFESEYVTNNIHNWIDLIFGYKQTGEAAVQAINCFHPSTYYGMDRDKYKNNKLKRDAFYTMIKTLGNTPQQLFFSPHPMVALTLAGLELDNDNEDHLEVIDTVSGLRWGNYVGSPSSGPPSLVWCRKQSVALGSFLPLLTNYVFALSENVCLLLNHKKDTGSGISRATYIMSAALVSWAHRDGIVRIKLCRDQPTLPLLRGNRADPVCLCASVPDCKHLFVAHKSGIINAYTLELNASDFDVREKQPRVQLHGHSDAITSIYICKAFSVFATSSLDKTVIIWDLNRLCYVRSLTNYEGPVTLVSVSETLADIASVCNIENGVGSILRVYTINGDIVGSVQVLETITALCYSTAPEGLSVNVIATGLNNGVIRLWSSWDLKLVRVILCDRFTLPIKCLAFSADNQHLYASNEDGTVTVWEKPSRGLTSVPRLLIFT